MASCIERIADAAVGSHAPGEQSWFSYSKSRADAKKRKSEVDQSSEQARCGLP